MMTNPILSAAMTSVGVPTLHTSGSSPREEAALPGGDFTARDPSVPYQAGEVVNKLLDYINTNKLAANRPVYQVQPSVVTVNNTGTGIKWVQPSGPRKPGEGIENEEQGILSAEPVQTGVMLRITLLAAGFIIGPSGASVRDVMRHTHADIKSWTEQNPTKVRRPCRVFLIEGDSNSITAALQVVVAAVDRYKELCEGRYTGQAVPRIQRVCGVEFCYQPPPRNVVPFAAALKGPGHRASEVMINPHMNESVLGGEINPHDPAYLQRLTQEYHIAMMAQAPPANPYESLLQAKRKMAGLQADPNGKFHPGLPPSPPQLAAHQMMLAGMYPAVAPGANPAAALYATGLGHAQVGQVPPTSPLKWQYDLAGTKMKGSVPDPAAAAALAHAQAQLYSKLLARNPGYAYDPAIAAAALMMQHQGYAVPRPGVVPVVPNTMWTGAYPYGGSNEMENDGRSEGSAVEVHQETEETCTGNVNPIFYSHSSEVVDHEEGLMPEASISSAASGIVGTSSATMEQPSPLPEAFSDPSSLQSTYAAFLGGILGMSLSDPRQVEAIAQDGSVDVQLDLNGEESGPGEEEIVREAKQQARRNQGPATPSRLTPRDPIVSPGRFISAFKPHARRQYASWSSPMATIRNTLKSGKGTKVSPIREEANIKATEEPIKLDKVSEKQPMEDSPLPKVEISLDTLSKDQD